MLCVVLYLVLGGVLFDIVKCCGFVCSELFVFDLLLFIVESCYVCFVWYLFVVFVV